MLANHQQAAELGSTEAKTCIGDMFLDGVGVERDLLVAEKWLSEAASAGSLDACHSLGRLLVRSSCVRGCFDFDKLLGG